MVPSAATLIPACAAKTGMPAYLLSHTSSIGTQTINAVLPYAETSHCAKQQDTIRSTSM